MKINILLPFKEKFDKNKASSVSITVKNNLHYSKYLNEVRVYGQKVEKPLFQDNFIGFKYSYLSFKSKNEFLANNMSNIILEDTDKKQLIEVHNRPYLVDKISKRNKYPISLFLHNDPLTMKGSKSIKDREKLLETCAAIFCVSKYIRDLFLDGVLKNHNKVHVLYNGVDKKLKRFPKKKMEILFVGRLVPEKGVHHYVNSIKCIADTFTDWNFGLIGSFKLGENKNTNQYANRIINKFSKIGSRAIFYGFQNHQFVQNKMKTASIIIIPSIWQEPFGLVAAEAMSNGACVIASKVGGITEIIENNGILIENVDHLKLKKTLIKVLNNRKLLEDYQKKSWNNFRFSSQISSRKLDEFRKIISTEYF